MVSLFSQSLPPKRFCALILVLSITAWASVACLNFVVNPYAQYPVRWFKPLVQTSRAQKVALLGQMTTPPEGLILGSSRVLKLEPEYLQEKTTLSFFNAGVNYAKPEDHLAVLRHYQAETGQLPRMVVLGLDVTAFSDANAVDARLFCQPELARQIPDVINFRDRYRRWQELLSWQQTKMSVQSLRRQLSGTDDAPPVESFRSDGVLVYHQREAQMADGAYDFQAALDYNKREYKQLLADFPRLSRRRCQLFETLVQLCRSGEVQLVVFTTPMHPELVDYLTSTTPLNERRTELIRYLQTAADRHRFQFHDLSDVRSFSGNASLFVDGIHPLEPNTRQMINRLLTRSPSATYAVQ